MTPTTWEQVPWGAVEEALAGAMPLAVTRLRASVPRCDRRQWVP